MKNCLRRMSVLFGASLLVATLTPATSLGVNFNSFAAGGTQDADGNYIWEDPANWGVSDPGGLGYPDVGDRMLLAPPSAGVQTPVIVTTDLGGNFHFASNYYSGIDVIVSGGAVVSQGFGPFCDSQDANIIVTNGGTFIGSKSTAQASTCGMGFHVIGHGNLSMGDAGNFGIGKAGSGGGDSIALQGYDSQSTITASLLKFNGIANVGAGPELNVILDATNDGGNFNTLVASQPVTIETDVATYPHLPTFSVTVDSSNPYTPGPHVFEIVSSNGAVVGDFSNVAFDSAITVDGQQMFLRNTHPTTGATGIFLEVDVPAPPTNVWDATVPGDANGDGSIDVADTQCAILNARHLFLTPMATPPTCSGGDPMFTDYDCDSDVDVVDVQIAILRVLSATLPSAIDADDSGVPDSCEP